MATELEMEKLLGCQIDSLLRLCPDGLIPLEIQQRFNLPDRKKETLIRVWRMYRGVLRSGRLQQAINRAINERRPQKYPPLLARASW